MHCLKTEPRGAIFGRQIVADKMCKMPKTVDKHVVETEHEANEAGMGYYCDSMPMIPSGGIWATKGTSYTYLYMYKTSGK